MGRVNRQLQIVANSDNSYGNKVTCCWADYDYELVVMSTIVGCTSGTVVSFFFQEIERIEFFS